MTDRRDLREEATLLSDSELCDMLHCSGWTLREWRRKLAFPQPIHITDGSPNRTRLGQVLRWIAQRERRRRRVRRRGKLRRGTELVSQGDDGA